MKKKKSNKKPIIAIVLIALIGVIGGTIAVFTSSATIPNVFKTLEYKTQYDEVFVSPEDWKPGVDTEKKVYVRNTGDIDVAVRISYTEKWVSKNNTVLDLRKDGKDIAVIKYTNRDNWIVDSTSGTTFYYYKTKLAPGQSTTSFIDSVEFNDEVDFDIPCTTVGTTTTCTSNGAGYDGATYTLTLKIETVQFDFYKDYWNTRVSIA